MKSQKPEVAITELQESQASLLKWMDTVTVTNDEEQRNTEDLLIGGRRALKEVTAVRLELTRPLDESKKGIIALFAPYVTQITNGITKVDKELQRYHNQKRIAAEAARLTALSEEAARIAEARDTGEILEPLAQAPVEPVLKTSRAHMGSVTYREDYDINIVDPQLVPRDLCEPSMPKIRARVKSGIINIPGVLVSKKYVTSTRTAGGN